MSDPKQAPKPADVKPADVKPDSVKVRCLTRILLKREFSPDRSVLSEDFAEAGDIIELPRAEAERLRGREFEGYPTQRDAHWRQGNSGGAQCSPFPLNGGRVRDPLVDFV